MQISSERATELQALATHHNIRPAELSAAVRRIDGRTLNTMGTGQADSLEGWIEGHNPDRCVDCRYEQGRTAGEAVNERWRGVPDRVLLETTDPGVSR
jgi:hypothetical protein